MQARDPKDRAPSITVGVGRAILSNKFSDSLVSIDVACRYLSTGEVDGAIPGGPNVYLRYVRWMNRERILTKVI